MNFLILGEYDKVESILLVCSFMSKIIGSHHAYYNLKYTSA